MFADMTTNSCICFEMPSHNIVYFLIFSFMLCCRTFVLPNQNFYHVTLMGKCIRASESDSIAMHLGRPRNAHTGLITCTFHPSFGKFLSSSKPILEPINIFLIITFCIWATLTINLCYTRISSLHCKRHCFGFPVVYRVPPRHLQVYSLTESVNCCRHKNCVFVSEKRERHILILTVSVFLKHIAAFQMLSLKK